VESELEDVKEQLAIACQSGVAGWSPEREGFIQLEKQNEGFIVPHIQSLLCTLGWIY